MDVDSLVEEGGPLGKAFGVLGGAGNLILFTSLLYSLFGWDPTDNPLTAFGNWWVGLLFLGVGVSGLFILDRSKKAAQTSNAEAKRHDEIQYEIWLANHPEEKRAADERGAADAKVGELWVLPDARIAFWAWLTEQQDTQGTAFDSLWAAQQAWVQADTPGFVSDEGDDQELDTDATDADESESETIPDPDPELVPSRPLRATPPMPGIVQNPVPQTIEGLPSPPEERRSHTGALSATVIGGIGLVIAALDLVVNLLK